MRDWRKEKIKFKEDLQDSICKKSDYIVGDSFEIKVLNNIIKETLLEASYWYDYKGGTWTYSDTDDEVIKLYLNKDKDNDFDIEIVFNFHDYVESSSKIINCNVVIKTIEKKSIFLFLKEEYEKYTRFQYCFKKIKEN